MDGAQLTEFGPAVNRAGPSWVHIASTGTSGRPSPDMSRGPLACRRVEVLLSTAVHWKLNLKTQTGPCGGESIVQCATQCSTVKLLTCRWWNGNVVMNEHYALRIRRLVAMH